MSDKLIEALEDFEGKLESWASAYPMTIFHEPSDEELKKAHEALKTVGLTLDVLSASSMRYVATSLAAHFLPVREALAASKQETNIRLTNAYRADIDRAKRDDLEASKAIFSKQEPQAQAEPEVVARISVVINGHPAVVVGSRPKEPGVYELITLQSHREAMERASIENGKLRMKIGQLENWLKRYRKQDESIAKKDAALEAQPDEQANGSDSLFSALAEARRWIGDGDLTDGLHRDYWTPEYAAMVDRVDTVLNQNLAATPPAQPAREWVGLTYAERSAIAKRNTVSTPCPEGCEYTCGESVAMDTESKLREKNAGLPAAVPDGYVLVPVEPTDDMLDYAQDRVYSLFRVDACSIWDAMLAAAPKPQDDLPAILKKQAS